MDRYELIHGDCFEKMAEMGDNSVDCIITDPPYFTLNLGQDWSVDELKKRSLLFTNNRNRVSNVRRKNFYLEASVGGGVRGDYGADKTIRFYEYCQKLAVSFIRILKPGGFCLAFSQPRLSHRMMCGFEDEGFWIRDLLVWYHSNGSPPRMQGYDWLIDKSDMTEHEKSDLKNLIGGRKTPIIKVLWEACCFFQKPPEGSLLENFQNYGTGLVDTVIDKNNELPSNVLHFQKEIGKAKDDYNFHPTVKPTSLIEYLMNVYSKEGDIILDPFLGSGTSIVAGIKTNRKVIGIERELEYIEIAKKRIKQALQVNYLF